MANQLAWHGPLDGHPVGVAYLVTTKKRFPWLDASI
jgi:hypothetical protein